MIKFYRLIRQQLLSENKFSKYLIYAIGEILLVVVGILIALSINNWNEKRKNNNLKQSYIENLKIDLNKDLENLEQFSEWNNGYEKSGFYVLDFMEENLVELDTLTLTWSIINCAYIPNFTVTSTTYNDIMTSNNINLFNDIKFKRILDNYYIRNEWTALFQNRILKTAWYDYRDEIIKYHSPLLYRDAYDIINGNTSIDLDDTVKYEIDWSNIKANKYLKRQVEMILAYRVNLRVYFEDDIKKARTILSYIESNN